MDRIECWKCGGFGVLRLSMNSQCPECHGEGRYFVRDRPAAEINADIDARHDWLARSAPPTGWRSSAVRRLIAERRDQGRSYLWIINLLQRKEANNDT